MVDKKREIASNPKDVDAVVKRAWKVVYNGMSGCMETGTQRFLVAYTKYIFRAKKVFEVGDITAQMVFDSFSKTAESAGSLDG